MKLVFRVIVVLIVVPATYCFTYWLPGSFLALVTQERWAVEVLALFCSLGAGWFVWKKLGTQPQGLMTASMVGAIVVGAIGFSAGFFGPIIFAPEANQGPLLGIFITGPLGFLLGGIGGSIYWYRKNKL